MTGTRKEGICIGILMAIMGLAFLAADLWEVVTSTVNLSQHVPILIPLACFGAIIAIVVVEKAPVAADAIDMDD